MFWEIRQYCAPIAGFPGKLNLCGTLIVPFGKRISFGIGLGYLKMKRRGVFRIRSRYSRICKHIHTITILTC
jgi:hypothetical protein